jgi:Ca-activated chloride channel family protein
MARYEERGCGASRSFRFLRSTAFCLEPLRRILVLAILVSFAGYIWAQDVNVHIEPKPSPSPTPPPVAVSTQSPDSNDPNAKPPEVSHDPGLKVNHGKPIQVDVDLVLVNVTVTDDWNRIVTGLEKDNFVVMEGNQPQAVKAFSNEDAPLSLGVIFDMSGSMSDKIEKAREAVVEFMKTANPQDEFFMVTFNDRPQLRADFTRSVEDVQGKLIFTQPEGRTALLDAIYMGINKMKDAHNSKKALLIISDGGDNHSRYTEREIKSLVREADVQLYSIGMFTAGAIQPEEIAGPALLTDISEVTGGRMFTINNPNELADVATKIGIELRNQYVLGYRPTNKAKDGRWRKIKVKLLPPKGLPHLNVYSRTGYYAPSQ